VSNPSSRCRCSQFPRFARSYLSVSCRLANIRFIDRNRVLVIPHSRLLPSTRHARRLFIKADASLTDAPFQAETATNREGSINQVRSSSSLVKRACSYRTDYVCLASVRYRDHDHSCGEEGYACRRFRNIGSENIPELRNDCSGGDAVDIVLGRECDRSVTLKMPSNM
jgi:hypothetical protein